MVCLHMHVFGQNITFQIGFWLVACELVHPLLFGWHACSPFYNLLNLLLFAVVSCQDIGWPTVWAICTCRSWELFAQEIIIKSMQQVDGCALIVGYFSWLCDSSSFVMWYLCNYSAVFLLKSQSHIVNGLLWCFRLCMTLTSYYYYCPKELACKGCEEKKSHSYHFIS